MQLQQQQKELLLQILTIIRYAQDKEKFVKEFEAMNYIETLVSILEKLPQHVREVIRETVMHGNAQEIKKYLSQEVYDRELAKTATEAVKNFVKSISSRLTLEQKEKIAALMRNH